MKNINWLVRFKNPVFIAQLILSVILPILAYAGLEIKDLTSWLILGNTLLDAIKNPYVIGLVVVSVWHAVNDPTTAGLSDSTQALGYHKPRDNTEDVK
ncbi:phage holin [Sporolactobacillus terrae]|uniref:phage holin n=1 Tax=Sporolactobacillus terrae TaxID=269673 RepID=UPI00048AEF98|nr:phage holin [Sporolactobacillus terrae]